MKKICCGNGGEERGRTLIMVEGSVSETLVYLNHLARLSDRSDYIEHDEVNGHEEHAETKWHGRGEQTEVEEEHTKNWRVPVNILTMSSMSITTHYGEELQRMFVGDECHNTANAIHDRVYDRNDAWMRCGEMKPGRAPSNRATTALIDTIHLQPFCKLPTQPNKQEELSYHK
jgi:hypothetical protein